MVSLSGAVGLLERALGYTLGGLGAITPEAMSRPTPCPEWDLHALVCHVTDSLAALHEAIDDGHVALDAPTVIAAGSGRPTDHPADPADPVATCRDGARNVLGSWVAADGIHGAGGRGGRGAEGDGGGERLVTVGDCPPRAATAATVACVGAIEIAVHGWDIYHACGRPRPIPPTLAADLLALAPAVVTDAERPSRFAAPVSVPPSASPGDRLVAFLGRDPG
ncbi:MAG TPA: TIGR03086 family metal-binding protein [Streptosporangiaceae bacterium]|nr:TIGR03086 family metal-binding protein [Streptosporangiaceae bacterium]